MEEVKSILKETLEQINEFRNDYISNEQAVRTQLIEPVLNVLGWKTSNPKFVRPNAPDEDGKIPDYSLLKNSKTILIVEAKNLKSDLQDKKIIDQLANYCYKSGINFGVLTNGAKWLLFKTFENNPKDRIIWQVNIESDKIEVISHNLSLFSYHNIDKLDAMLKKRKILDEVWQSLGEAA
jgi:predicted type IV restriction endonuclease